MQSIHCAGKRAGRAGMGKAFNGGNCVANRVDVSEILQQIGNLIESLVLQELEQGLEPKIRQPHPESGLDSRGDGKLRWRVRLEVSLHVARLQRCVPRPSNSET